MTRRWKSISLRTLVIALIISGAIIGYLLSHLGAEGTTGIEHWVGRQLASIANAYLNPVLTFDHLDYQYPSTVVLENVQLTSESISGSGEAIEILSVERLTLELLEVPKGGQPFSIERLVLESPVLRFIEDPVPGGSIIGYSQLVKTVDDQISATMGAPELSEVFQIRWLAVRRATLEYDPATLGHPVMQIDDISSELALEPTEAGLYAIDTKLRRSPMVELSLTGQFHLDRMDLNVDKLVLSMDVNREQDKTLPPQVQAFLQTHDITGRLHLVGKGTLPRLNWERSDLSAQIELANGHFSVGPYRFPVSHLSVKTRLRERQLLVDTLDATALKGSIKSDGRFDLSAPYHGDAAVRIQDLAVEEFWSTGSGNGEGEAPLAGRLQAMIRLAAPMDALATQATGEGEIRLREGRIARFPLVSVLSDAMGKAGDLHQIHKNRSKPISVIDVELRFEGDHAHLTSFAMSGAGYAARGEGRVYFDSTVDLQLNAGPIEKIQDKLGDVGHLLGKMTDALTKYTVTGTITQPKIGVKILHSKKTAARAKETAPKIEPDD